MEKPQTLQPLTDHTSGVQWAVAVENLGGQAYLSMVHLATAESGEQILEEIRKQLRLAPCANLVGSWTYSIFTKIIVGTAKVHKILAFDLEQQTCFRVNLEEVKDDSLLTEAFHNPKILLRETNYVADNYRLVLERSGVEPRMEGQKVIFVRRVLDKSMIAWVLMVLLLVSPGLGIAIGILFHRLDVGVAVSAGIFALASFLLALAKWFH